MPGKGLLPDPGPSAGGARRLSPGGPGLLRSPSTDPGQATHGSGFMGGRQSPQQHNHQHKHGGGGRHAPGKRSSGDRGMGSWQGPAKRSRGSNGQQRDNPYITTPGGNPRERSQQQPHAHQSSQQSPAGPPAGAAVPRPVSVYNGPREGSRGLALGFNYWVHDSRRILASHVRELITSILCGTTPPPFVRTKDVSSLRRVVVAVVQGMPSQQVLGELPRCPTLSAMSVAPTVFAAEHNVSKPEQMSQASTALLWGPQPHVAVQDLAGRPLRHIFKTHALYFAHGSDTKAQAKWEDRLLFRPSSTQDDTHADQGGDGGVNAGSAVNEAGGGKVEELEEGEQEEDAEAAGTVVRLKGHDKGTWSLKGGRELRLVWPDGTVEVLTAEPWPPSSTTLGSSRPAASAAAGSPAAAEGTLTFTGATKGQEGTTARLTLVEAVLTDVFDENEARDKQQGMSEADDHADPPLAPGGLQANRWLVDAVEAMTDTHINAFALTEQERLRMRYPISIRAEGSIGWVSPGTGALLEEPAPVPAVPGDDGGWVEEDYGGWGDANGAEDEEQETSATNGHADSSADADMAVDNGGEGGVAGGCGNGGEGEEENGRRSRLLGIDCEMCKTEHGLELSRITLVDVQGELVLDRFVQPGGRIIDYNTQYSGVSADHLDGVTTTLKDVQRQLVDILEEKPTFLVGHALDGDLRALRLVHSLLIDTSALYPHPKGSPWKRSLKDLANDVLGRDIQQGHGTTGHDSRQDASAALELAMLKMVRGHDFMVPSPWSHDPSQQPRESLFRRVSRACNGQQGGKKATAVVAVGPMHGMALHGSDEQGRRPNRVWSSYNRGYRREGDGVWTAVREDGGSVCSVECGSADDIVEHAVKAVKGDGASSPSLLWVEMPCKDYYSYVNQAAASVEAPQHFTNLEMIDGAVRRLLDAADDTTLVAVSVQGDTYPVYSLLETKQRCRWDEPRKDAARPGIAGTVRAAWTEEDERQLLAAAIDTLSGVTFLGVKTT